MHWAWWTVITLFVAFVLFVLVRMDWSEFASEEGFINKMAYLKDLCCLGSGKK